MSSVIVSPSILTLILAVFLLGYLVIIFEFYVKVNKTAVGLFIGGATWLVYFVSGTTETSVAWNQLGHHLSEVSQILFFLMGAMTLVELIDSHKGFSAVIALLHTTSKRVMLTTIAFLTFFLSAFLDNLTTTILMISIIRKLIPDRQDRLTVACMVVIAANAGGAWTVIGDVTTTMLWINGEVSTIATIRNVFIPSMISMIIPLGWFLTRFKGKVTSSEEIFVKEEKEPGATTVFVLGLLALVCVPIIKWLTGMPPFMGMIIGLSVLWFITDIIHFPYDDRHHLRIPFILTKIDVSSILFFLGILLAVDSLEAIGLLREVANWLEVTVQNSTLIASAIGVLSAIVDNVPLVAATMGMYDLTQYPADSNFWLLLAYTAGTGGSLLIIGSAAGVAMMGMEKIDFFSYFKKATAPAFVGYAAGVVAYVLLFGY
ncbi:MAG: Na(+)/H(+) antiporter NhaD [Chlamydiia bacterium]|nr:Na(+)/H(+) antiporter NhaD [Chlamydiia bacterium]